MYLFQVVIIHTIISYWTEKPVVSIKFMYYIMYYIVYYIVYYIPN